MLLTSLRNLCTRAPDFYTFEEPTQVLGSSVRKYKITIYFFGPSALSCATSACEALRAFLCRGSSSPRLHVLAMYLQQSVTGNMMQRAQGARRLLLPLQHL